LRWLTPLYYSKNKNSLLSIKHNCIFKKSGKHLIFRLLCTQLSLMEKWLIFYFSLLACKYTRKSSFKPEFQALLFLAYLLYISTSGFHIRCGGILRSFTPPYSEEFHRKLTSFHSWEPISINSVENRDNQQNKTKKKRNLFLYFTWRLSSIQTPFRCSLHLTPDVGMEVRRWTHPYTVTVQVVTVGL